MNYLLDTHVLLWALAEPDKLSALARHTLEDLQTGLYVSSASLWEIATKHRLGKLPQAEALVTDLSRHLAHFRALELPISHAHALLAGQHPAPHRDPFDRMLAAQSQLEKLPLITQDAAFQAFEIELLW